MRPKRHRSSSPQVDDSNRDANTKRRRTARHPDILSTLSDELLIRALSFLDESSLLELSQVSRRFLHLASDSQLWRPHYYRRFILPRAHRVPGLSSTHPRPQMHNLSMPRTRMFWPSTGSSSKVNASDGADKTVDSVDWKKRYKLRHNWTRGRCAVEEVPVHPYGIPTSPDNQWQTLVRVVEGLAVTADSASGLRAWDLRTKQVVAQVELRGDQIPTCIAVEDGHDDVGIAVGFVDGTFAVWKLVRQQPRTLILRYKQQPKSYIENLVSIAYRYPYVLTAKHSGLISVYSFEGSGDDEADTPSEEEEDDTTTEDTDHGALPAPYLLTSLKSYTAPSPLALSLRKVSSSVVASIAYTFDTPRGWSIGVQDLEISPTGIVVSRLASTLPTETRSSASSTPTSSPLRSRSPNPNSSSSTASSTAALFAQEPDDGPTRLSYSHPYLLATLPDNTLALHLCTSTDKSLTISKGLRLWGHTSGISDADITPRGKAVSVSTRGNEIRLWELEGKVGGSSVTVRPRESESDHDRGLRTPPDAESVEDKKNWVGFDDEMVIVLKETKGRDSLLVYDFT